MKEGIRYSLERPPLIEELNPGEDYLKEYTKWFSFKCLVENLSSQRSIEPAEFISSYDLYQETLEISGQEDDEGAEMRVLA